MIEDSDEYKDLLAATMYGHSSSEARELINAFAHKLAELQREWIADRTDMPWWADVIPDVIDPYKNVGPVRPDEEPT
ncbi:hypothetical protein [Streptomyces sp. SID161]|uniref:hypothetical protein n=1 Tax=Streptomyces sp. SID161 TaxID=2690251 RepID=UPI00136F4300|nr:hypothetical protein [Streptomyces sp. SID161]MYW43066.1 hypothetical protein [Streptomyces sp. SID161]